MPTPAQTGPFSYDEYTFSSSSNNRTLTINKSAYDTSVGEILEVYVAGTLLDSTSATAGYPQYTVNTGQTQVTINGSVSIADGARILLQRVSNRTTKTVDFQPGSVIREADLDGANNQIFRIAQEAIDTARDAMPKTPSGDFDASNNKLINLGYPSASTDGASKAYVDAVASGTGQNLVSDTGTYTLTNKTIDVDNNTVTNIEVDNLKSGVLDTDLSNGTAGTDTTLASAKAIKTYVDAQVDTKDQLSELDDITITSLADNHVLSYHNSSSKWKNQTPADAGLATTEAANSSAIVMAIALG
tara:strand:+ start:2061 stop:2963 length:903 start_codon:yes stop_codon:yes gene_type:complete